ncbi:MAG: hypothetical protein JXA46_17360 [Dehalococcoidales bacterium]|nr:hypothetical protein [Dehalococcoidales bacterium]
MENQRLLMRYELPFQPSHITKEIYFTREDFHINHRGQRAETTQIDVYLDDVPNKHKNYTNHTLSSIHGVKGETYDAILLLIESRTGKTLTPSFLNTGNLGLELMRIAYVAMTRPRKLLAVAMPNIKSTKDYGRFPKANWDYEYMGY